MKMDLHRCSAAPDGVWITNEYFSGHLHQTLPSVFRSIATICNSNSGVSDFYIGVASGIDYFEALQSRIDSRKVAWGVTHMYLLYGSSSERYTRAMEHAIEAHFSGKEQRANIRPEGFSGFSHPPATFRNATGGGGGRRGQSGNYFLYLAFRKA